MNIIAGMIVPEMNWAPKLALKSSSLRSSNAGSTSSLPAEDLDQLVAGERLLDVRVELAGVWPTGR